MYKHTNDILANNKMWRSLTSNCKDDKYTITNVKHPSYYLIAGFDYDGQTYLQADTRENSQWIIKEEDKGEFKIVNVKHPSYNLVAGLNFDGLTYLNSESGDNAKWKIISTGNNDEYRIINVKHPSYNLVAGFNFDGKTYLNNESGDNSKWEIKCITPISGPPSSSDQNGAPPEAEDPKVDFSIAEYLSRTGSTAPMPMSNSPAVRPAPKPKSNTTMIVVGAVAGGVILLLTIVLVIVLTRRKKPQ